MAQRFIGRTYAGRLRDRMVLDSAMVRSAVLMGPNARHVDPSILDVDAGPLAVTFDINLLFAEKPERVP
jgi:hypothetical protein